MSRAGLLLLLGCDPAPPSSAPALPSVNTLPASDLIVPIAVPGPQSIGGVVVGPGPHGPSLYVGRWQSEAPERVRVLPLQSLESNKDQTLIYGEEGERFGQSLTLLDPDSATPLLAAAPLGGEPTADIVLLDALAPTTPLAIIAAPGGRSPLRFGLRARPTESEPDALSVLVEYYQIGGRIFVHDGPWEGRRRLDSSTSGIESVDHDHFSTDFDTSVDFDGDGIRDLMVSSWLNLTPVRMGGAGYVFLGPLDGQITTAEADMHLYGDGIGYQMGFAMAVLPDTEGDGLPDVAISEHFQSPTPVAVHLCSGSLRGLLVARDNCEGRLDFPYDREELSGATQLEADGEGGLFVAEESYSGIDPAAGRLWWVPSVAAGVSNLSQVGLALDGGAPWALLGNPLERLPDLDGDGRAELLVGHSDVLGTGAPVSYLPSTLLSAAAFE